MKIIIQTPDIKARETLLNFVTEKVEKLGTLSDQLLEARVTLRLDKSDTRENKICVIKGVIPGNDLFVEKQATSFEEATLKSVETMKRQISDWKAKKSAQTEAQ